MRLLLVVVCISALFQAIQGDPEVLKAEYEFVSSRVLGNNVSLAKIKLSLSEDLYYTEALPCLRSCEGPPQCAPCDYSVLGDSCGTNSQCGCTNQTARSLYCDVPDWEKLEVGVPSKPKLLASNGASHYYRYYHYTERCVALIIRVLLSSGNVELSGSFIRPRPSQFEGRELFHTDMNDIYSPLYLCPTSYGYKYGTLALSIISKTQTSNYTVTIEEQEIIPEPEPVSSKGCVNISPTLDCVEKGVPKHFTTFDFGFRSTYYLTYTTWDCEEVHYFINPKAVANPTEGGALVLGIRSTFGLVYTSAITLVASEEWYGGGGVVEMCPPPGENLTIIFDIYALVEGATSHIANLTMMVETRPDLWKRIKIADYFNQAPWHHFSMFWGTVNLNCTTTSYTCSIGRYSFTPSCWQFFPNVLSPLLRIPPDLLNADAAFRSVINKVDPLQAIETVKNNELNYAMLLSFDSPQGRTLFLEPEDFRQCKLIFSGLTKISNVDGKRIRGTYTMAPSTPSNCTFSSFEKVYETQKGLAEQLNKEEIFRDSISTRYAVDILTFSTPWVACNALAESFLNSTLTSAPVLTDKCVFSPDSIEYTTDPCCNVQESWGHCCVEQWRNASVLQLSVTPDVDKCDDPDCLSLYLNDFIYYQTGCSNIVEATASQAFAKNIEFYRKCETSIFGTNLNGIHCQNDEECPSGKCDLVNAKCFIPESQVESFIQCLDTNMPDQMRQYLNLRFGTPWFTEVFTRAAKQDCWSPYGPANPYHSYYEKVDILLVCTYDSYLCLDPTCSVPLRYGNRAEGRTAASRCSFEWRFRETKYAECGNSKMCNWNSSVDPNSCESVETPFFCGICESEETSCRVFDQFQNAQECEEAGYACFLASGEVVITRTEQECEQLFSCDVCINGADCTSESNCFENGGKCTDEEVFTFMNQISRNSDGGRCFTSLNPFNNPDCNNIFRVNKRPLATRLDVPWNFGCATALSKQNCSYADYIYIFPATNRASCISNSDVFQRCDEPSYVFDFFTPKPPSVCEQCLGTPVEVFTWIPGNWKKPTSRKLKWVQKQPVVTSTLISTFSFGALSEIITQAATYEVSFQLQSDLQCTYNAVREVLRSVSCTCSDPDEKNECFPSSETPLGSARICPFLTSRVTAPPVEIIIPRSGSNNEDCYFVDIYSLSAYDYANTDQEDLVTSFVEKPSKRGVLESVENDHDAPVGEIINDGFEVRGATPNQLSQWQHATICIDLFAKHGDKSGDYSEYDFGSPKSSGALKPLSAVIFFDSQNRLCGNFSGGVPDSILYPIVREEDFQSKTDDSVSGGDQAALLITSIVFGITTLWCFFVVFLFLLRQFFRPLTQYAFPLCILVLGSASVLRFIYFLLIGAKITDFVDEELAEFFMIEVPTFLYITAYLMVTVVLFVAVLKSLGVVRRSEPGWLIWTLFFLGCIILIVVFIIIVILFETRPKSEVELESCGNKVIATERDNNESEYVATLRIVYRSIVCGIVSVVSISLLAIAIHIYYRAATVRETTKGEKQRLFVVTISFVGLLANGIGFIIYYAVNKTSSYFSFFLIATEAFPWIILSFNVFGNSRAHSSAQMSLPKYLSKLTSKSTATPTKQASGHQSGRSS